MAETSVAGVHAIDVIDKDRRPAIAKLELRYRTIKVLPPTRKQKRNPSLTLTVIYTTEAEEPLNRERIDWKLITNLPITSPFDVALKLSWSPDIYGIMLEK